MLRPTTFTRHLGGAGIVSGHRIRLVGPWDFTWREAPESDDGPDELEPRSINPTRTGSVPMPCDWQALFGTAAGCATFSRRFHRPTNLDANEQVVIILTGVGGGGKLSLNGSVLTEFTSTTEPVEADVTDRLLPFNVLEVSIHFRPATAPEPATGPPNPGGLFAPVVLEIRQL